MRKLFVFIAILLSFQAAAQTYVPSASYGNKFNRGRFDSAFFFPTFTGKPTTIKSSDQKLFGLVGDSLTGKIYKYNPRTLAFADLLDSAFIRAVWVEATRELTLTRADGSTFKQVISGGGSGGSGATDFTLTRVDSILTETWNNGPSHSININDARIKQADINKWNAAIQLADLAAYLKKTDSTTIYASKYYNDTGKNRLSAAISTKIGIGTAAGGDLSGTYPNPTVAFFNGQAPAYYLNYNNLTNKLSAGTMMQIAAGNVVNFNPGGTSGQIVLGNATLGTEQDPKYIADTAKIIMTKVSAVPGSANLNNYVSNGLFYVTSDANAASGTNFPVPYSGVLEVQASGGPFTYQKYHVYGNYNNIYYRTLYNSSWSAWYKVPTATDINTQDLASVLNVGNTANKDIILGDYASATGGGFYSRKLMNGKGIGAFLVATNSGSSNGMFIGMVDQTNSANNKYIGLFDNIDFPQYYIPGVGSWETYTSKLRPLIMYQYADHIGSDIPQTADTLKGNTTTFAYNTGTTNAGTPYSGTVATFGGKSGNYQLQLSSNYISSQLSFRTKNSDLGTWNAWRTVQSVEAVSLQNTTNPVGANTTTNTLQITGATNAPTSGVGAEISYQSNTAYFLGYDRTNTVYRPVQINGADGTSLANALRIDSILKFNTYPVSVTKNIAVPGTGDFNTLTSMGVYFVSTDAAAQTIANIPVTYSGVLEVTNPGNLNTFVYQRYHSYKGTAPQGNKVYYRNFYGGGWSPWREAVTTDLNTLQATTTGAGFNTTSNSLQITGNNNAPASGSGSEIAFSSGVSSFFGYDRTNKLYLPTQLAGGNSTSTNNSLKIAADLTYNNAQVWYSGGTLQSNSSITLGSGGNTTSYPYNMSRMIGTNNYTGAMQLTGIGTGNSGVTITSTNATGGTSAYLGVPADNTKPPYYSSDATNALPLWYTNGPLQSNSGITLGAAGNTTSYPVLLKRNISSVDYTSGMGVGTVGPITGANVLTAANATVAQTAMLGIAPNGYAPVYSADNGTTSNYLVLESGSHAITTTNTITGANLTTAGTTSTAFIKTTGSKPTVTMASGATGTATLNSTANTTAGTITVNLTNTVPINANLVQLSFANSIGVLPVIQITPGQSTPFFLGSYSAGGFTISSGGSSAPGTYIFNYFVVQ